MIRNTGAEKLKNSAPVIFLSPTVMDDPTAESLWFNYRQLAGRVRALEKLADVWDSPWWKLVLFVIDGWPLKRIVARPQRRPWHRWWNS